MDYAELAAKTIKMPRVQYEEQKSNTKATVSEQKLSGANSIIHEANKAELMRNSTHL